ncbi:MAG: hypothetical protein VXY93_02000 [Pseudomonadota bacterium]|nr:hypothetical protein [Pseudomonadota bacterium]
MTTTPLLDMIENMDELRRLPEGELQRLAAVLRTMPGLDAASAASSSQKKTSS